MTVSRPRVAGRRPHASLAVLVALTVVSTIAACGGERTFEVREFVEEANVAGAGIELGEPLSTNDPAREIYSVELASSATEVHGGGSLTVTESPEAGEAEYRRCESAATLACYRAANIVLIVEADELAPEQLSRVEDAFRRLGS